MCTDPQAAQARRHFQKLAGQAICMMAVFCESVPEQFLSCQSISLLDGASRMPLQAFERLKVMSQPFKHSVVPQLHQEPTNWSQALAFRDPTAIGMTHQAHCSTDRCILKSSTHCTRGKPAAVTTRHALCYCRSSCSSPLPGHARHSHPNGNCSL